MGLDLEDFALLEGVHDNLDRARFVLLIHSCEESPSIVHHFNLIEVDVLHEFLQFFTALELSDRFVHASGEDKR